MRDASPDSTVKAEKFYDPPTPRGWSSFTAAVSNDPRISLDATWQTRPQKPGISPRSFLFNSIPEEIHASH